MHYLQQKMTDVNKVIAWVAGFALLATCLLIATEVFLRKVLNYSIIGVDEICGYVLAVMSAWIFGFAAVKQAHIRVDTLLGLFPSRFRPVLDLLASLSLVILAVSLAYYTSKVFWMSFFYSSRAPTPLQTPLWIPQLAFFLGIAFFALTMLGIVFGQVRAMAMGVRSQMPPTLTGQTGSKIAS
jgi:TRAP-type C4-dicarboxylate transport system permease small subunit